LLPSAHTSPPLPLRKAEPLSVRDEREDDTIVEVHKTVFSILEQDDIHWDAGQAHGRGGSKVRGAPSKQGDIGDGGMYI
jgi:hypothetical protein